jgi:hypothetical protein
MATVSAHSPGVVPSSVREPLRNSGFRAVASQGVREWTRTGAAGTRSPAAAAAITSRTFSTGVLFYRQRCDLLSSFGIPRLTGSPGNGGR